MRCVSAPALLVSAADPAEPCLGTTGDGFCQLAGKAFRKLVNHFVDDGRHRVAELFQKDFNGRPRNNTAQVCRLEEMKKI